MPDPGAKFCPNCDRPLVCGLFGFVCQHCVSSALGAWGARMVGAEANGVPLMVEMNGEPARLATPEEVAEYERCLESCKDDPPRFPCGCVSDGSTCRSVAHGAPLASPASPAEMLGNALYHLNAARALLAKACSGDVVAERADDDLDDARARIVGLMSEAHRVKP